MTNQGFIFLGQTEMEAQFQRLSRNKAPPSKFQAANLPVNKHKNRYANVLPYDDSRVKLAIQPGIDGSDYINANYIGGYMQKRAFIATQAPIPDTIPDFWRMIWEQECHAIVMLSQEMESGKVLFEFSNTVTLFTILSPQYPREHDN